MKLDIMNKLQLTEIINISFIETKLRKNFEILALELNKQNELSKKQEQQIKNINTKLSSLSIPNILKTLQGYLKKQQLQNYFKKHKQQTNNDLSKYQKINNNIESKIINNKIQFQNQIKYLKEQLSMISKISNQNKEFIQNEISKNFEVFNKQKQQHIYKQERKTTLLSSRGGQRKKQLNNSVQIKVSDYKINQIKQQEIYVKINQIKSEFDKFLQTNKSKENLFKIQMKQIHDIKEKIGLWDGQMLKLNNQIKESNLQMKNSINLINSQNKQRIKQIRENCKQLQKNAQKIMQKINQNQIKSSQNNQNHLKNPEEQKGSKKQSLEIQLIKNQQNYELLKKEILSKLENQKKQYVSLYKKSKESKQHIKTQPITIDKNLQQDINTLKFLIQKKTDEEAFKKGFLYLQNKINYIYARYLAQNPQSDARIGKKADWTCLSCDRNLKNFTGKIGDYILHDLPKGKKLQINDIRQRAASNESRTIMKSKSKIQFPSVISTEMKKN